MAVVTICSDFGAPQKKVTDPTCTQGKGIILPVKYADDTTLMAESEEELKSLLMKLKEESEKFA